MTDIDDEVRSLLATAAERIAPDSIPPLRLPRARVGLRLQAGIRRWPSWLGPVAAAASVAVIAAASLVISDAVADRPRPVNPGESSVPPYYIALTGPRLNIGIYSTRTGALAARVVPPARPASLMALTAAADDRTFALAVPDATRRNIPQTPIRFYLVKFNPATRAVRIIAIPKLRAPGTPLVPGIALSPSGTKLAVSYLLQVSRTKFTDELKVIDLATGRIRTWTSSSGEMLPFTGPYDLNWANDNTTLGFNWYGFTRAPERRLPTSGFRLLKVDRPSGDLIADSRRVLRYEVQPPDVLVNGGYIAALPVLAPDGRTIVAAITSKRSDTSGRFWFAAYDSANGRLQREFDRAPLSKTAPLFRAFGVLWTDPSASLFVVAGPPGHARQFGILDRSGHLTVLPLPAGGELFLDPGPAW